jgi:hypothetical protein
VSVINVINVIGDVNVRRMRKKLRPLRKVLKVKEEIEELAARSTLKWPPYVKAVLREYTVQHVVDGHEYRMIDIGVRGAYSLDNYVDAIELIVACAPKSFTRKLLKRPTGRVVNAIAQRIHKMFSHGDGKRGTKTLRTISDEHPFIALQNRPKDLVRAGKFVQFWLKNRKTP